jgi:hypothetical protein
MTGALHPIERVDGIPCAAARGTHAIVMLLKLNPLRKTLAMFNAVRCGPRSLVHSAKRSILI